jgi:hypothetical protein
MRCTIILLIAGALAAPAQTVTFGGKVGVPVATARQKTFATGSFADHQTTQQWTAGPTIELHLKYGFSFEVDALYRKYRADRTYIHSYGDDLSPLANSIQEEVAVWDIPFLIKYRFLNGNTRPFFNLGISLTHETNKTSTSSVCLGPSGSCTPSEWNFPISNKPVQSSFKDSDTRIGGVLGGGVEFRHQRLRIAPEIRYTRLTNPNGDQVTLLVGITF